MHTLRHKPLVAALLALLCLAPSIHAAGKQLTGKYAPTPTPALPPAEAEKNFIVPEGFEVRLFAAEPDVINPVAMTWDTRGRLWVVELFEYPLGAPEGAKPRDTVKILEDTDGDGRADKVTIFADGLNLATGLLLGYGGAFVGQAPHLFFMEDTDGDDRADKRTIVKTGFGLEDRHELLNGFTWGPDGWLYMTHGVFTHSKVRDPENPDDDGVIMNAAVARFHPRTHQFEVFADGTSNPWGVDFDRYGNAFVSACVIDHLFHMAPGGLYTRQAGTPAFPYAYELLPSIVDHRHFLAAYAGVQVYQGDQFPEEYLGSILIGNIHDSAVHQDRLSPNGSSFKASFVKDFLRSRDGWFRPVSTQIGPDGAVWIMDWYDKYPCYQNANADPEGVDRAHGRIWRVVYTGKKATQPLSPHPKQGDLANLSTAELVSLLGHRNVWHRRTAQRLLTERKDKAAVPALETLLKNSDSIDARLAALWTLHTAGFLSEDLLNQSASHSDPAIRTWAARITGERGNTTPSALNRLERLAADPEPSVRLAVATALRQFVSGSLTVNTPPGQPLEQIETGPALARLVRASAAEKDPVIPFMIWMAAEPKVAAAPGEALGWLSENGESLTPLAATLTKKVARRICDGREPLHMNELVNFLSVAAENSPRITIAALDGLLEGQKGKILLPSIPVFPLLAKLGAHSNAEIVERAQRLGTLWGDPSAFASLLETIKSDAAALQDRVKAVQSTRHLRDDAAREALLSILKTDQPSELVREAIGALTEMGGDSVPRVLIQQWQRFSTGERRAAAEALAARPAWTAQLLNAIEGGQIQSSELPVTVVRTLGQSSDKNLQSRIRELIGYVRPPDTDKLKLIAEKRNVVLNGPVDLKAGHELAKQLCLTCHKLHGEGAEIGPDLTGVGRSTLDALLANVIDPNQIIGKGYENVVIETKDERTVSGRLIEDSPTQIKLLSPGPREEVISRSDIASMTITEVSVMPEGLEQLPDQDFRNLIWYILNPPQDNRPLTPEVKRELLGAGVAPAPLDRESVALWNPHWKITAPEFDGTPTKIAEHHGRKNVLVTHPFNGQKPASLQRTVELRHSRSAHLAITVAAHEKGDWELRVFANDKLLAERLIEPSAALWRTERVDLSKFAGEQVVLRLEQWAGRSNQELAYWQGIDLEAEGSPDRSN